MLDQRDEEPTAQINMVIQRIPVGESQDREGQIDSKRTIYDDASKDSQRVPLNQPSSYQHAIFSRETSKPEFRRFTKRSHSKTVVYSGNIYLRVNKPQDLLDNFVKYVLSGPFLQATPRRLPLPHIELL